MFVGKPFVSTPSHPVQRDMHDEANKLSKSIGLVVPSPAPSVLADGTPRQEHEVTAERVQQVVDSFVPFTDTSYAKLLYRLRERRRKDKQKQEMEEARLVDGDLVIDDDIVRDPKLTEGKTLPKAISRHFPKHLLGAPLEDIDPYCREYEETCMVVTKRFNKFGFIIRVSASPSLYLFPVWNPVRRLALYTFAHPLFDLIVIFTILANALYMAMNVDESVPEYTFLALYTFEGIVKAIARGMIMTKYTYLRDPWNWLDFIVLISAYATIIAQSAAGGSSVNIQALRTFRVFRVLKTIAVIPGLKRIIEALIRALRMLSDVYLMTFFFFTIFALFGVQLFEGALKTKCVIDPESVGVSVNPNDTDYTPWTDWIANSSNWNFRDDSLDYQVCGNASGAQQCPVNFTCLSVDSSPNPQHDFTNFDNFYSAFMVAIQMFNTDYWDYLYASMLSATGYGGFFFFLAGIVLLSYYLANLFQAVVALSYQVDEDEEDEDAVEAVVGEKKKKPRFVFDPWRLRNYAHREDARTRSLISLREVTERRLGVRKNSMSLKSNQGSNVDDLDDISEQEQGSEKEKRDEENNYKEAEVKKDENATEINEKLATIKPVAIVRPQITPTGTVESELPKLAVQKADEDESSEPTKGVTELRPKWPGMSNLMRYHVRSRPPSAMSERDLPEIGFWDRNPICCMICCVGYFPWLRIQHYLLILVTDPFFDLFITATIVVNTVSMASYYHGIPDDINTFLDKVNDVCTYIFFIECALKLMALCGEYFANRWNWLDFCVVIGSVVDIVFTEAKITFSGFNTSIIRLLRLLRILKLAKSWKTMRTLLEIIFGTIGAIANLMLVLLIVIFIFAVIGMQLFSTTYEEYKFLPNGGKVSFTYIPGFYGVPEWNFNDFFHAFMVVFRVLCRETYQPMWDCITANSAGICVPFFLAMLMIGSYVVLNLFMAVLLNAFSSENLSKMAKGEEDNRLRDRLRRFKSWLRRTFTKCFAKCCRKTRRVNPASDNYPVADDLASTYIGGDNATTVARDETESRALGEERSGHHVKLNVPTDTTDENSKTEAIRRNKSAGTATKSGSQSGGRETRTGNVDTPKSTAGSGTGRSTAGDSEAEVNAKLRDCCWPILDRLFPNFMALFTTDTQFGTKLQKARRFCVRICIHKAFEFTILGFIFASSFSLCLQDANLVDGSTMDIVLNYLDYVYLAVFTVEMLIKLFAFGVRVYFTSFWTVLDFFIVTTGYADLIMGLLSASANLAALRALRTLRALRPLRMISRWQGMKIVVNALISAIPPIANVLLVVMIIWLIFAIMGVQFFAGKFWFCIDSESGDRMPRALVPNKEACLSQSGRVWGYYLINFDNIGNAYLALLQVATFEGWTNILQYAVDSPEDLGDQHFPELNINYYVYFVVFIVICSFFLLNLFVGVIIDGFNALKKKYEGNTALELLMTDSQKVYYNTIRKLENKKPKKSVTRPKNKFAAFLFDIGTSSRFEAASAMIIASNVVVLATSHHNQVYAYTLAQEMLDLIFTTMFTLEAALLLIALRQYYFFNIWNVFDFIIVILSVGSYGITDLLRSMSVSPTVLRLIRLLRIGRVLRLIRSSKGIRKLLFSFIKSVPALFNICCLLFLVIFIYGIIGMNLFGHIGHFGGNVDDMGNFHTFGRSFFTLFRLTTSSGWDNIHQGLSFSDDPLVGCQFNVSLDEPLYPQLNACCNRTHWKRPNGEIVKDDSGWGNCGNFTLATIYCVSYLLCTGFIIVNMFAAVILDNYQQAVEQEDTGVTDDDVESFYRVWEQYDPAASQFLALSELNSFAADLDSPLNCPKPNEQALTLLDIPILKDNKTGKEVVHCVDVLVALIRKALGYADETEEFAQVREMLDSMFRTAFPNLAQVERVSSTKQRKKEDVAARTLQRAWRSYQMEKTLRKNLANKPPSIISDMPISGVSIGTTPASSFVRP